MTQDDLDKIEALIKKHKPDIPGHTWIFIAALMFIGGCFKGCGY